jgi:hypothetical protein
MIERAKRTHPEIQKHQSGRILGDAIEDCINGRGRIAIHPIGWEAVRSDGPRWMISFYFQDVEHKYLKAIWE